jgi:hypothetical protein
MRIKELADPVAVEPPRSGEDAADCIACNTPDDAYIWVSERWRVRAMDRPTGLPMVLILECRSHLDLGDLPNLLAAELGVMTVRLERSIRSLDGVARVHVNRWGDGSAHLHMWFLARPYGRLQLRGTFLSLWDDILPTIPEQQWRENLALVAAWLADFGGQANAEPPHIQWQSPLTFTVDASFAGGDVVETSAHGTEGDAPSPRASSSPPSGDAASAAPERPDHNSEPSPTVVEAPGQSPSAEQTPAGRGGGDVSPDSDVVGRSNSDNERGRPETPKVDAKDASASTGAAAGVSAQTAEGVGASPDAGEGGGLSTRLSTMSDARSGVESPAGSAIGGDSGDANGADNSRIGPSASASTGGSDASSAGRPTPVRRPSSLSDVDGTSRAESSSGAERAGIATSGISARASTIPQQAHGGMVSRDAFARSEHREG